MQTQTLASGILLLSVTLSGQGAIYEEAASLPQEQVLTSEHFADVEGVSVDLQQGGTFSDYALEVYPKDEIAFEAMKNVVKNLIENSVDLDPEIVKIVDNHFWELV